MDVVKFIVIFEEQCIGDYDYCLAEVQGTMILENAHYKNQLFLYFKGLKLLVNYLRNKSGIYNK